MIHLPLTDVRFSYSRVLRWQPSEIPQKSKVQSGVREAEPNVFRHCEQASISCEKFSAGPAT